jgi:hypothetical protein
MLENIKEPKVCIGCSQFKCICPKFDKAIKLIKKFKSVKKDYNDETIKEFVRLNRRTDENTASD